MKSLYKNQTQELVKLPIGQKIVGSKWVHKKKDGIFGMEDVRYKTRLVAKVFTRREDIDYNEIFFPIVKHTSIRVLLAMVALYDLELQQLNVKTAFLRGELEEQIFMRQLEGFRLADGSHIYMLYVDDMLIAAKTMSAINGLKEYLKREFEIKDFGAAKRILGMEIQSDRPTGILYLFQKEYIEQVLQPFETEYIAATEAVKEAIWLKGVGGDLGLKRESNTIYSQSDIHLTKNQMFHELTKHIDVRFHFIRDVISQDTVMEDGIGINDILSCLLKLLPLDGDSKPALESQPSMLPESSRDFGTLRHKLRPRDRSPFLHLLPILQSSKNYENKHGDLWENCKIGSKWRKGKLSLGLNSCLYIPKSLEDFGDADGRLLAPLCCHHLA
ncbi:hypothetical protein RJ639_001948 [Escallonia herrerae]|uniref:Reverse transcriptase Ty1/copia-type domain-containing protein n=1 Tax=Escallonia herrerae TaxID=1293975 RepID=A0AA88XBW8_9ASTE|nr:hypothetical protein RJ639_001948 [Escallonia herrerae]